MSPYWLLPALLLFAPSLALGQPLTSDEASTSGAPGPASEPTAPGELSAPARAPDSDTLGEARSTPAPAPIEHELVRYQLANGLRVVLQPDPTRSRVAVAMSYHVGSRDDPEGFRGLAHLTEHVMFEGMAQGTGHTFDEWLAKAGATKMNGLTGRDHTVYFEELPSSEVKLGVWLEAIRMAYLLSWADETIVERARAAVLHEHEGFGAGCNGFAEAQGLATLYPEGHPYHRPLEDPDDIEAIELAHVQWFFQHWYGPDNATLVVVGNFELEPLKAYIASTLGPLSRSGKPATHAGEAPVELAGTHQVNVRWQYGTQICALTWPVPASARREDDRALDVLATHLAHRLNERALSHEALQRADALYNEGELSGEFQLSWRMEKDADRALVRKEVEAMLADARTKLLTPSELARARDPHRRRWLLARENLSGRALYFAEAANASDFEPSHQALATEYANVEAERVRAVAQRFLPHDRVVDMCAAFKDNAPRPRVRRRFVAAKGQKP